jgi:glycosyltransferase involved in cell wall biosynthesis
MIRDFLLPYAEHYRRRGWRVDALAQTDSTYDECAPSFDRAWTIEWSRNPRELRNPFEHVRALRDIARRERYDIVHFHTPIAGFLGRAALRRFRSRHDTVVIYTAHGFHFHPDRSRLGNAPFVLAERMAGRWTDYLVVINEADEQAARRYALVPPDRLVHMPGIGIDTQRFRPEAVSAQSIADVRNELGLGPGTRLVLVVAEFTANKRHADAVRAFARIQGVDAHLALAGRPGPALASTRRLVTDLRLDDRAHFLGHRNDIPALIRASTATVLLSAREGLPVSVLESLCLARPVIGTNVRGISDLLLDGGGSLVPVGDAEGAARALQALLDDPERAQAIGRQGRENMTRYDIARVIQMHDALYERALSRQRSR